MSTYITITRRAFWTMKVVMLAAVVSVAGVAEYFIVEHVKHQSYLRNRESFIEQHRETQFVLSNTSFCYEPRGGLMREAVYKGNNLYRVKP